MDKRLALSANLSQLLILLAMLIYAKPNYLNISFITLDLLFLIIAGILLFFRLDFSFMDLFISLEIIFSIVGYSVIFHFYSVIIAFLLILFIIFGMLTSLLPEISLLVYFISFIFYFIRYTHPFFGTDEVMIDYYSAYLFIHGLNPYNPINTANVYTFYNISSVEKGTPLTTGGVVTNLNYPSLAFLIQIPTVLLKVSPNYTLVTFFLATILLYFLFLLKQNSLYIFPYFISAIFLNLTYVFYSQGGVTDIMWVFFVSFSFFVNNIKFKGILYGLALSLKQIPLLLLPFWLIYLYKEKQPIRKFLLYSIITFFVFNGYFIFLNPKDYFYDLLYPITANLIGIGFGPSIFSFNGMFYIYKTFFTISMIVIGITEIILFFLYYKKFQNTWTAFPYFVLFLEYRVLWNYLMYWPFFNYIDKQKNEEKNEINQENNSTDKKKILGITLVSIIIILSMAFYFHYNYTSYEDSISINILKILKDNNGYVRCILLNISYIPKNPNLPKIIHPYFRIFPNEPLSNANGIMLKSNITYLQANSWEIVKVYPYSFDEFKLCPFELQAYYGNLLGITYSDH
ncbi:hypothetical protein DFR86_07865 [Acidianus sulfidivorans JP7]|uniref:DUF2029 domain-containing protein n=1 Tax=Acidianus sulfidivorans JP7 TaxID=619593 RepID=A0A2U9IN67_9CREN|nr:hypothetical protein [Acidianus sulfidivorans]AWR97473.1 hypothetical protein DFR86_07865 [Acidianus sulfidivorans JP7]